MKILLAVDESNFSQAATQALVDEIKPAKAEIRVLTVVDLINYFASDEAAKAYLPNLNEIRRERLKKAGELLDRIASPLRSEGFQVSSGIAEGDTRTRILEIAEQWGADLIVLGSHGRRGLDRALIGSVAEAVARHARCSVQIVRSRANQVPRSEVPGSEGQI